LFDTEDLFNNERGRAYYECLTYNQTLEIIIQLSGTTKLVFELANEGYTKALKYNFFDILKNYSYYIINYYNICGDKRALEDEEKKYLMYVDFAQKEQFAKYLYMKVSVNFSSQITLTNEILLEVYENLKKFDLLRKEINNPEIDFYFFYLAFLYYESNSEIDKVLSICDEAELFMKNQPSSITNTRRMAVLLYKLKAFLHLRKFQQGISLLNNEHTILIPETSYNWYILKEIEFKLYLQDKKISEAYNVHQQVLANKSYKRQVAQLTEKWKIYHAYLVFMDNYLNKGDFKFSLSKFLNDVPVNTKDKSGYNFAIRIIEMLFQMARKDYNLLFSKMDALRVYRSRYLNDNTYKRNHMFLGLLLKAEKCGFMGKELQKADWPEITELRKQNNYFIADWEIIPYEELWDIFVELAKQ
jgi:hypothetical protein